MKNYVLIILLSVTPFLFAQQSGVLEYEFSYQDFADAPKNKTIADARKNANMSAEYAREHKYVLKFNPTESLYYIENSMPIDGVDNEFAYKFSKYFFSNGIFYQNRLTYESLNETFSMNELYLVKDSISNDWEITSESKNIGKFKCYKAISSCTSCNENQIVTAWFTPEIPIPFGPAGFGGTPGLILEVSKYRYTLRLKQIKFSDKKITIKKPSKGILTTSDKLKTIQMERRKELMNSRQNE